MQLIELGANHVFTYDELADKAFAGRIKELTGGKVRAAHQPFSDISLTCCVGHTSVPQLRRRKRNNADGTIARKGRASRHVRRYVKAAAIASSVVVYIQKPHNARILAESVVQGPFTR